MTKKFCTISFCTYLPTHSYNTLTDQRRLFEPLYPNLRYHKHSKSKNSFLHPLSSIPDNRRVLSKFELNHIFGKAYSLDVGTLVLHRNFKVNPKSSRKLQPMNTDLHKIMRRIIEVNYEILFPREIFFLRTGIT